MTPPVEGAIEAPFIVQHGNDWYLFVSWDFCCRGPNSDYKVVVGRAEQVTGPYRDRDGKLLSEGGGTLILEAATDQWRGAGHPAIYREGDVDYLALPRLLGKDRPFATADQHDRVAGRLAPSGAAALAPLDRFLALQFVSGRDRTRICDLLHVKLPS